MTTVEPIDYKELASDLDGIACDYPTCEPGSTLKWVASTLTQRLSSEDAPLLLIGLHSVSWYAVSGRIRDPETVDIMIDAVEQAATVFGGGSCPHVDGGGHPDIAIESPDSIAGMVLLLHDEQEWIDYYGEDFNSEERAGWLCPGFLAKIARETLETLRDGRIRLFEAPDTSALDQRYLRDDGSADIAELTREVHKLSMGPASQLTVGASTWAARRLIDGARPEERLPLLLVVCFAVKHAAWKALPPAVIQVCCEALNTLDLSPSAACPHDEGHPTAKVHLKGRMRLARALYAPDQENYVEVDEDAVRCPRYAAEEVKKMLDYGKMYLEN